MDNHGTSSGLPVSSVAMGTAGRSSLDEVAAQQLLVNLLSRRELNGRFPTIIRWIACDYESGH